MQERLFEILFDKDEVTWQTMLYDLVRSEEMNPWDIDIAVLAQKFFEMIGTLKEMDFRIPGKIILAAAILLKIKSVQLMGRDLDAFDSLFAEPWLSPRSGQPVRRPGTSGSGGCPPV